MEDIIETNNNIELIDEGFILLKGFLTKEEQIEISKISVELNDKFIHINRNRYRIYDAIPKYPKYEYLLNIVKKILDKAIELDSTLSPYTELSTHLLFLRYADNSSLGFHRDDDENDGCGLNPVISLSIGNSCRFTYKDDTDGSRHHIKLNNGDVLLFGGKSRYILHSVSKMYKNSPDYIKDIIGNNRLNLTFRYAPNILGREHEFESFP